MRPFNLTGSSATAYGTLIEKIEILRSTLRWASHLDRPEIQRLLKQCNALRDEVMLLSRKERFIQASAEEEAQAGEAPVEPLTAGKSTQQQRRQGLIERRFAFEGVFGENPKLLEALEIAEKAAPTDLSVLVEGESGTGKELLAKVIHANSRRGEGPFISVNCGAIPNELLESELFGHKKGAFTGAASDRKGKFESANGGTIFLDEIGELPLQGQVKLLRVLQSQEIQRVGSDEVIHIDTRIVAATNRNLHRLSREERFREDLFYRLSVISIILPPLRERRDEIPLLIDFFSDEAAEKLQRPPIKMLPRLRNFLLTYSYPGNIRELRNIILRLSCLADDMADFAHLPENIRSGSVPAFNEESNGSSVQLALSEAKKAASNEAEKLFLEQGLREVNGRVTELAKRTGMNRSHLQTLLKKHGLSSKSFRTKSSSPTPP
jgi:transcriptional regulator with PAS, ATPase and Fis domain